MFVHCTGCHAEISHDREACPHCDTPVVSEESKREALMAENFRLNMELHAAHEELEKENASLAAKLATLRAAKPAGEAA